MASQDGRRAWTALVDHFDGGGQKEKRISKAEAILTTLSYNNERVYSFESYAARLLKAFRTLENTPNRRTPSNQVKILIDNIKISSAEFAVIKGHVRANFRANLHGAIEYISREVSELFPDVMAGTGGRHRHRFVSETTSSSRPRQFNGLTHNGNGVYHFYGVDVTDVQRRFTSQEMHTLGPAGQAYIHSERARIRGQDHHGGRGNFGGRGRGHGSHGGGRGRGGQGRGGYGGGRGISEVDTSGDTVITDITNDQTRASQGGQSEQNGERGSHNGRRFGAGAYGQQKETRDKGRARAKGKAETSAPSRVGRRGELGKWRRVGCWKRETGAHSEGMKWIPWRIPAVQGHQR